MACCGDLPHASMAPLCQLCCKEASSVFCRNDEAYLCAACDVQMHVGHPLASRHERVALSAAGVPAQVSTADPDAELLLQVEHEPLDDLDCPLLAVSSPIESGSTQTVAGGGGAVGGLAEAPSLDEEQVLAIPPQAKQGDKELDALLDWDGGALLDFGLELDVFENEIMSNNLASDAVVPNAQSAESSCCSGGSAGGASDVTIKADKRDVPASSLAQPVVQNQVVPGMQAHNAMQWAQHAVPQMAMQQQQMAVQQQQMALQQQQQQMALQQQQQQAYACPAYGYMQYARPDAETAREARHASIKRYREKRQRRIFNKTIRYQSRKAYAEIRPRIKGRFAKREEVVAAQAAAAGDCVVPSCR